MKDNTLLYVAGGLILGYLFSHHIGGWVSPILGAPFGQVKKDMRMPVGQQQSDIMSMTMAQRQVEAQQMMMPH